MSPDASPAPGDAVVLDDALVDRLARAAHEEYRRAQQGRKELTDPAMRPWESLSETLKESNRAFARDIPRKLGEIGCSIVEGRGDEIALAPADVEKLAAAEHDRWNYEKLAAGYRLGPRDHEAKTTPYLVPYGELSEDVKEYDREAIKSILPVLRAAGLGVVRPAKLRVFVVRDFETPDLEIYLEGAVRRSSDRIDWIVPGITYDVPEGEVFRHDVRGHLLAAHRVLVGVDSPNGNVGFEVGHALGQGAQVSLFHVEGEAPPAWLAQSPFESYGVARIRKSDDLIERALRSGTGVELPRIPLLAPGGKTLVLAPREGPCYEAALAVRQEFEDRVVLVQEPEWNWSEAPQALAGTGPILFFYDRPARGGRDGRPNTVHAAIAGYLTAHGGRSITVLQHRRTERRLVDLGGSIRVWDTLADVERIATELVGASG